MMPGDFSPWEAEYQQTRRWLDAGCLEAMGNDLRSVIRVAQGRQGHSGAVVQQATGQSVEVAWADQGYTGEDAKSQTAEQDVDLQIIQLPEAKKGCVLLPRHWVVVRSVGWLARFRRLNRGYERLPQVLVGLRLFVFVSLMSPNALLWLATSASSYHALVARFTQAENPMPSTAPAVAR